ncbi:MAG: PAS domain-containing protein, partial [Caldilineaceae bacterium]|nr:PAS domain-containing protein [Caldilineaceae bacterium]
MKTDVNADTELLQQQVLTLEASVRTLEGMLADAIKTESVLRQLAEHSGEVFWLMDLGEGTTRYVSPAFERVYGLPPAAVRDDPAAFLHVVHPEDRRAVAEQVQAQRQGRATRLEYRVVHPDGSIHWLLDRCIPMFDDAGNVQSLAGVVVDITERKAAEDEAIHQKTLLRAIIDLLPESIYAKDRNGRKILANQTDVRYMGVASEAEALGLTDGESYPAEIAARFQAADEQVMELGKAVVNQEEMLFVQGERRYLLTSKVPLRDASGAIVGLIGVGRDITELKEAEFALHELNRTLEERIEERTHQLEREIEERIRKERELALSERRLRQIIDLVPHMIFAKDLDGRYILANRACAESLGTTVEELIGRQDSDFNPFNEDVSRYVAEDRAVVNSGDVLHLPEDLVHFADGTLHILQTVKIPFVATGDDRPAVL